MGITKFSLRLHENPAPRTKTKPETKAEAAVYKKNITRKEQQIAAAVEWCQEIFERGRAALKTGMFPLIKERGTIDRRLDGKVKNAKKKHLRVLLPAEEKEIVQFVKKQEQSS